ncbi:MAG: chorismate mutase, partial [Brevundimonas sp.]|uniref:chorismate mutase n=1 Tax=Brevundimonas sp. TaxID=1871086 RepID=UPI00273687B8
MPLTLVKSPDETAEAERLTLAALRHEIDLLDSEMVALFQKRLALADRVGRAKDAPTGGYVKLRPDREQAVLAHVLQQAKPDTRDAVEALWREVVG